MGLKCLHCNVKSDSGGLERSQWLRALPALFWCQQALHAHVAHTDKQTHIHTPLHDFFYKA